MTQIMICITLSHMVILEMTMLGFTHNHAVTIQMWFTNTFKNEALSFHKVVLQYFLKQTAKVHVIFG